MVRGQQTNKKNRRIFPFLLTSQHILDNMVESYLIVSMRHDISVQKKKTRRWHDTESIYYYSAITRTRIYTLCYIIIIFSLLLIALVAAGGVQ